MTYPFEIPSYVQGYRFSDESDVFYDAATKTFKDQAGYGSRADLVITAGSPVFDTVGGKRCVRLDNTFHGLFPTPIPWMGSVVAVIKPEYVSGATLTRHPLLFGNSTSAAANGALQITHASGQRRVVLSTPNSSLTCTQTRTDNNLVVVGFATDQETRKGYATNDGATITETTAPASTTNGNAVALGWQTQGIDYGARFGDMDNLPANLTALTDFYCEMFELHFFADNIWTKQPAKAAELIASLRAKYGVV